MHELLDLALHAQGGLERWRQARQLDVRLSVSGGLFQIKGHPEGLRDVVVRIEAQRPAVTVVPFGAFLISFLHYKQPRIAVLSSKLSSCTI
jgi:hypothetical protein